MISLVCIIFVNIADPLVVTGLGLFTGKYSLNKLHYTLLSILLNVEGCLTQVGMLFCKVNPCLMFA